MEYLTVTRQKMKPGLVASYDLRKFLSQYPIPAKRLAEKNSEMTYM